jgi:O-antigen/teichoic acid export membrane protein
MQDTPSQQPELKELVVRGVGWMMVSQAAIQVLALVTAVVIVRFLGPREVGLAAEALVFSSLAIMIMDLGGAYAVVQRPMLTEVDKSTAFWAAVAFGLALTLIGIAVSWPIASLYGEPRVQALFAVLSLGFLFTALGIVQVALLTRELRFRTLEVRTIISTALSSATGIALAVAGFGPWAIVAQHLVITSASTALVWRSSPWRPRAAFSSASLKGMAAFTSHVIGTRTLTWGTMNLDNFLIGRFLGAAALGAYTIAFSLIVTPVRRVAYPLMQVFFPAFSRMRDPERIARAWLRGIRMVALGVVPTMLGLIVVAPDFVEVVFGEQWRAAVAVIQILATVGLLQSLSAVNDAVLQALDRTRELFRFTAVLSISTVAAFAVGLSWGINGVAWAYLVVTVALHPLFLWLTTRAVGVSPWDWLRSVAGVMQASAIMVLIVLGSRELMLALDVNVAARLALLIAIGLLTYVPLVAWRAPEVRDELRELLARRRRVSPTPTPTPVGTEAPT